LAALILFTLGNSADSFFLLRLSKAGVEDHWVAVLWAAHSAVKMASTGAGGVLYDRIGGRPLILGGWILYAVLYACFGFIESPETLIALFLLYGVYFGLTEPAERAWTSVLVPPTLRGTAYGYLSGAVGFAVLPANLLFGFLWEKFGAPVAFLTGAGFALAASILLWFVREHHA
ncbi:MAG: MFS transporter, partial [Bdellovibrionota bacterium]